MKFAATPVMIFLVICISGNKSIFFFLVWKVELPNKAGGFDEENNRSLNVSNLQMFFDIIVALFWEMYYVFCWFCFLFFCCFYFRFCMIFCTL